MKVLFVCSGGMSSAIVVNALKNEGNKNGLEMEVLAVGTQEFVEEVKNGWDVAMIAPQVRHRATTLQATATEANVPCDVIPPTAYTPMGGPALLKKAKELLG